MAKIPVMEVALPGQNLETCTDDQKVFSSRLNTSKVAHREETTGAGTYSHGLAYTPAFMVANGQFDDSDIWGFVGQYPARSYFEVPFYCDDTIFYYWTVCKFFLFYQDIDI